MRIIKISANENGSRDNMQYGADVPTPDGWAVIPDDMAAPDTFPFVDVTAEDGIVTNLTAVTIPVPMEPDINIIKSEKIKNSKGDLANYLENHPLTWTDGKQYSVTAEKQSLLTGNLSAYSIATQLGVTPNPLMWNTTGFECTEWTFANLGTLALAIQAYVKPFVAYQQSTEIAINNCVTIEEVDAIVINYDNAVN